MSKDTGGPATAHEAFARALEEAAKVCEKTTSVHARGYYAQGKEDEGIAASNSGFFAAQAIRAIPNPYPASEWVKVSERLPEIGETVLLVDSGKNASTGFAESDGKWFVDWAMAEGCDFPPAYWMPLPTPPEEKP